MLKSKVYKAVTPSKRSNLHVVIECFPDLHGRETLPVSFRSTAQTLWEALNWTFIVNNHRAEYRGHVALALTEKH